MTLFIPLEDLASGWKAPFIYEELSGFHLDYATNAIHCWFGEEEVIIFKFKDYGWINDNRFNIYNISAGSAGIIVQITKTNV